MALFNRVNSKDCYCKGLANYYLIKISNNTRDKFYLINGYSVDNLHC
jgi:hypothetical protein